MKIIRFQAENLKRLVAVEITPKGDLIEIAGDNGNGKTSVLDAIEWALVGADSTQPRPVRDGQRAGFVTLELGDGDTLALKVTRRFDAEGGSTLTVERANGDRPKKPQTAILDALYGALAIDPLQFMRQPAKERLGVLKGLVTGYDFDAAAERRTAAYEERRDIGREVARLKGVVSAFPDFDGVPNEPVDTAPLYDQVNSADAMRRARLEAERQRTQMLAVSAEIVREGVEAAERAAELREEADRLDALAKRKAVDGAQAAADAEKIELPPEAPDVTKLLAEIKAADETNTNVEAKRAKASAVNLLKKAEADYEAAEADIAAIDKAGREAVAKADLPVDGLTLGDEDVMFRGLPLSQASDAEQLRVSMAIAMALSPKLRVIRVRDGSLLDKKAMGVLREVAAGEGWQIWIERVDPSGPEAIIMEDGKVKP